MARPNQATIDLSALAHNVDCARSLAPRSKIMAVVKANAYGHSAILIAGALQSQVDALAVASTEEALELRYAGITAPILLLEGVFDKSELETAVTMDLWVTVSSEQQVDWLEQSRLAVPVRCWLKVNTGMHRLGVAPDRAYLIFQRLINCNNVADEIVTYTHFASADDPANPQTEQQLAVFNGLTFAAQRSAANSAGVLAWPAAHYDWIRPGYMLYGNSPMLSEHANAKTLVPVMTLSSAIIALRDVAAGEAVGYGGSWVAERPSRIATVTIGYGDGYPRHAPSGTPVLINGRAAPLAGRVSMDMITVDVTELDGVQPGDEVVLWGPALPVNEVARHAGTVGYELTTGMPARTPRVAVQAADK